MLKNEHVRSMNVNWECISLNPTKKSVQQMLSMTTFSQTLMNTCQFACWKNTCMWQIYITVQDMNSHVVKENEICMRRRRRRGQQQQQQLKLQKKKKYIYIYKNDNGNALIKLNKISHRHKNKM